MGSWSIYCGFSNKTITHRRDCVLIPIKKIAEGIDKFRLYTLPIFGKYNDYGGIEEIQKDFNTDIIESVFGDTIENFCKNLFDYEIKDVEYMWVDGEVWNFMKNLVTPINIDYDLGLPEILIHLGFKFVEKVSTESRYNLLFEKDGLLLYSDGKYLKDSIHTINAMEKIGVDCDKIKGVSKYQLFPILSKKNRLKYLSHPLDIRSMDVMFLCEDLGLEKEFDNILKSYKFDNYQFKCGTLFENDEFCQRLCDVNMVLSNAYVMSKELTPFIDCITPQCGELEIHLKLLDGFREILIKENTDTKRI